MDELTESMGHGEADASDASGGEPGCGG